MKKPAASQLLNVLVASASSYAEFGLYLLCGVLVARALGPEQYGIYAFSVWLCGWLILLCNNGLTISAIRYVAESRGREEQNLAVTVARLMRRWQVICLITVLSVAVAALVLVPPNEWANQLYIFIGVAVLSTWARSSLLLNVSIGKGFEDFSMGNFCGLVGAAFSLILIFCWRAYGGGLIGYFAIYAVSGFVAFLCSTWLLKKYGANNW